jgi:hypothetical protein
MWYPSWYKKISSTKEKMEIPAPGKGNMPENVARFTARGADNDDDSFYFTIDTLRLSYKD